MTLTLKNIEELIAKIPPRPKIVAVYCGSERTRKRLLAKIGAHPSPDRNPAAVIFRGLPVHVDTSLGRNTIEGRDVNGDPVLRFFL